MSKTSKPKPEARFVNGREYWPGNPASEQPDVRQVTNKLIGKRTAAAAAVHITEEELRHFALVYPRLYQLGPKNRGRLERWKADHDHEVRAWNLSGFFNSKEEDEQAEFEARKPGIPADPQAASSQQEMNIATPSTATLGRSSVRSSSNRRILRPRAPARPDGNGDNQSEGAADKDLGVLAPSPGGEQQPQPLEVAYPPAQRFVPDDGWEQAERGYVGLMMKELGLANSQLAKRMLDFVHVQSDGVDPDELIDFCKESSSIGTKLTEAMDRIARDLEARQNAMAGADLEQGAEQSIQPQQQSPQPETQSIQREEQAQGTRKGRKRARRNHDDEEEDEFVA